MRGIFNKGIHVTKNCKAVSLKDFRNNKEYFGTSCMNDCMNGKCKQFFIGVDGGRKSQMRWHKDSREHRRVTSESSSAAGDHLK